MKCPKCGNKKMHKAGFAWSGKNKRQRWRCPNCGATTIKSSKESK